MTQFLFPSLHKNSETNFFEANDSIHRFKMKLLIGFIAATLPAYHALAATVDWKNVSSNKRVCTKVNDGGNVCKTSVS